MKTIVYTLIIAAVATLSFSSCKMKCKKGSGTIITDNRKVADFTKINVSGGFKIVLKQDSSLNLNLSIDDNLLEFIETEVSGGKLTITTKKNICPSTDAVLTIGVKNLEEVKGSGAITFNSEGKLNVKDFSIDLSGAGRTDLDLSAANVRTEGSGATEIKLKGQAASNTVNLKGSSKVSALDFVVGNYNIETTGAGDYKINVLKSLIVKTTGASSVEYRGNPSTVEKKETGSSTIKKID
ncbi:DUF2807 domain-containing protein [Mucilaginibacter sp. UR6-1]|uniref:head GIN domain-containing protein n=1 Tax=Mucilaginibacter sp. UR6-1 TaxID=1435643 RepID=UPI001E645262|nr:head GIN domain-containing protein [Mucilaginibacter sp. UR6-1]MCC8407316.1 DUF2807 domain-containing protein [Mucilaginibacter sp. UR6-1]